MCHWSRDKPTSLGFGLFIAWQVVHVLSQSLDYRWASPILVLAIDGTPTDHLMHTAHKMGRGFTKLHSDWLSVCNFLESGFTGFYRSANSLPGFYIKTNRKEQVSVFALVCEVHGILKSQNWTLPFNWWFLTRIKNLQNGGPDFTPIDRLNKVSHLHTPPPSVNFKWNRVVFHHTRSRVKIDWGVVITGMGIVQRSESLSLWITQTTHGWTPNGLWLFGTFGRGPEGIYVWISAEWHWACLGISYSCRLSLYIALSAEL